MKILIVEDEVFIAYAEQEILELDDHETELCHNGREALELILKNDYDLILLDIMLPEMDGFEIMEKTSFRNIPVIMVTAKNDIHDRMKGYRLGAVDYIVKPFELLELKTKVDEILTRVGKSTPVLLYGDLELNLENQMILKNHEVVGVTQKEFELAKYFIRNQGILLDCAHLMSALWGDEIIRENRVVENHVRKLQQKLGWQECLIAVGEQGYKLQKLTQNREQI